MSTEINESGLTDKQERFAHEYLIDQNASAACLRAGYSAHSRGVQAAQLMANPAVRKRIKGLLEELYSQVKLNALQLMQERMRTAFFDPRRLFDADSQPIPFKELDAECAGVVVVSYDTRSNGDKVTRVRQPSRAAALTALEKRFMQFLKMQQEDTITERENADFCLALGNDPERVAAGGVVRLTGERGNDPVVEEAFPESGIQPPSQPSPSQGEGEDRGEVEVTPSPSLSLPLKGREPSKKEQGPVAVAAVPVPAAPAKVCVPNRKVSKSGWSDAWGNIDVDHPHIPPEVKARELEKRRRKQEEEAARNNPGLLLNYMHSTVGQPNPPWPRELARAGGRGAQRFAITEDDPHGAGGSDY